jgi:UDP-glucose 4-epimerase
MEKAVVTGGAGFIGSHVVDALLARGFEVHVVDNFAGGRIEERLSPKAAYHEVDIRDRAALESIFDGASYIFHLAALPRVQDSIDHPLETTEVNVNGTLSVLEAAKKARVQKVVFSSSAAIYGDHETMPLREDLPARPKSPYGLHKYVGEHACALWSELYGVPTVSLRYFNVYGPRFDPNGPYALVVGKFIDRWKKNLPLTITGDGTNTRDYVHVSDVVNAQLLAAECTEVGKGEVFNIGSGSETSVNDLANFVGGEKEYIEPRIEPVRVVADIARAKARLGWEPTRDVQDGLRELMNDYRR